MMPLPKEKYRNIFVSRYADIPRPLQQKLNPVRLNSFEAWKRSLALHLVDQATRVRKILGLYKGLGPSGAFATTLVKDLLQRADKATIGGDAVEMIEVYKELKNVKEW